MHKVLGLVLGIFIIFFITKHNVIGNDQSVIANTTNQQKLLQNSQTNNNNYYNILENDIVLGNKKADKYIIAYTSLTCPHCADFYNKTFPIIKTEFIDTHKIAFVNRSFLSDRAALAGTMLAFCNGKEDYYTILKVLFSKADYWVMDNNYIKALEKIGSLAGISPEKFNSCMTNQTLQDRMLSEQNEAIKQLQIMAIPVFIINGTKVEGMQSFDKIKQTLGL